MSVSSIISVETKEFTNRPPYISGIVKFLGYVPLDTHAKTLEERIVNHRRLLGITQKELANRLGVDPSTLGRWETNEGRPQKELLKKLNTFLRSSGNSAGGMVFTSYPH